MNNYNNTTATTRSETLERRYQQACLEHRKALENMEQAQLELLRAQRILDEMTKRKRAILSQLAGRPVVSSPTTTSSTAAAAAAALAKKKKKIISKKINKGGQRLGGGGPGSGKPFLSRLLLNTTSIPRDDRSYKIGERLRKKFHGQYYEGTITALPQPDRNYYHVSYDDGDREDISVNEMKFYIMEEQEESAGAGGAAKSPRKNNMVEKRPVAAVDIQLREENDDDDDEHSSMTDCSNKTSGGTTIMDQKVIAGPPLAKKQKSCPLEMLVTVANNNNDNKATTIGSPKKSDHANKYSPVVTDIESPTSGMVKRANDSSASAADI